MIAVSSSYTADEISKLDDRLDFDGFVKPPFETGELVSLLDRTINQTGSGEN